MLFLLVTGAGVAAAAAPGGAAGAAGGGEEGNCWVIMNDRVTQEFLENGENWMQWW